MVGGELAPDGVAVRVCLAVEILIARAGADLVHGLHPEVVAVGAQRANGLLEGKLDFETQAVEPDDLDGVQTQVRAQEQEAPPVRMFHEHEAGQAADRSPQQIQTEITDQDVLLAVDGAGNGGPAVIGFFKQGEEADLASLQPGTAALRFGFSRRYRLERYGEFLRSREIKWLPAWISPKAIVWQA